MTPRSNRTSCGSLWAMPRPRHDRQALEQSSRTGGAIEADALAADDLPEDLGLVAPSCSCACDPAARTRSGCSQCPCSAQSLEDLGGEDREDLEAYAARVTAALVAARKRRKKFEQEGRRRRPGRYQA